MKPLKFFNLQLFADGESGDGSPSPETEPNPVPSPEAKYTDKDVDEIINKKFAKWAEKMKKEAAEAERRGKMTAEEQAAEKMKDLEDKVSRYEREALTAQMMTEARAILSDKGIHASDELISGLIADDSEKTKAKAESFAALFKAQVDAAVKDALKTPSPKTGGSSGITKNEILAVKDRAERQRLINENMALFTKKGK